MYTPHIITILPSCDNVYNSLPIINHTIGIVNHLQIATYRIMVSTDHHDQPNSLCGAANRRSFSSLQHVETS